MIRSMVFVLFCCQAALVWGAEDAPQAKLSPAAEALQASPNDPLAWRKYLTEQLPPILELSESKPDEAQAKLDSVKAFVGTLKPSTAEGEKQAANAQQAFTAYTDLIAGAKVSFEDLAKQVQEKPDDINIIRQLGMKVTRLQTRVRTDPQEVRDTLGKVLESVEKARESATNEDAKKQYEMIERIAGQLDRMVEPALRLAKLVGQDAVPLKVDDWVNGDAIKDEDLKGKVVLLDFWAVWCGPCIATFPHLREWNEKYEKKGLVIIGLTRYYNWTWDDEKKAIVRAKEGEKVAPEQEREMLKKFAEKHELKHRFGIQSDDSVTEYYAVSGIPHVVVIDQQGKIRMIKVGSGEANAKAIEGLLEKLLSEEVTQN